MSRLSKLQPHTIWTASALMTLLYVITGGLSLLISHETLTTRIVICAAEGVSLAGVFLFGRSVIPGVFAGQLILGLLFHAPFAAAVGIALGSTAEIYLAWMVVRHLVPVDLQLSTPKDIIRLFALSAFILQPVNALFGTLSLLGTDVITTAEILKTYLSWWFGNTVGQMLWTPMLLLLFAHYKTVSWRMLIGYSLGFLLLMIYLFFQTDVINLALLISLTMPLILLVTIHKGTLYGAVWITLLSIVALYATYRGIGYFTSRTDLENMVNINFFILAHILVILGTGTLYAEAHAARRSLIALNPSLENKVRTQVEKLNRQNLLLSQQAKLASLGEMMGMIAINGDNRCISSTPTLQSSTHVPKIPSVTMPC